jgi:hypothetical protein
MSGLMFMARDDYGMFSFWTQPGSIFWPMAIVFGAIVLVVLIIFIWAAFWRKPRHRHHSHHRTVEDGGLPPRSKRRSALSRLLGRKRHKRHHRERPANPTLSQIGGLPPHRDENPPS